MGMAKATPDDRNSKAHRTRKKACTAGSCKPQCRRRRMNETLHQILRSIVGFRPKLCGIYGHRIKYWTTRKFAPLRVPEGFTIQNPGEFISYWYFFIQKEFDNAIWTEPLRRAEKPYVLDIGANYGVFSRYIQHLNPNAVVQAFEPQAKLADYITKSNPSVKCATVAISDQNGFMNISIDEGDSRNASFIHKMSDQSEKVQTVRLDDFKLDGKPFLIKIDTEGAEESTARGGLNVLRNTPYIIIEIDHPEKVKIMDGFLPQHQRVRLTIIDYLYIRK
jgi:FkbM family methyltransferase